MRVHDSQAYRKINVTRGRISRISELREILLSFQTGFSLVSAAVVCAIPESILGLESAGVDNIPAELVQAGGEYVITALTTICNRIWQTGEWPTPWT